MKRLQGDRLTVSLGRRAILKNTSFQLEVGEMLGLIGPNGAGKTTLLRLLAGLLDQPQDDLSLNGIRLQQVPLAQRAKQIAYLAQDGDAHWPMSAERIIALGRLPHLSDWQNPTADDEALIETVMRQTDVLPFRGQSVNTLSGGERARVLLARALVAEPQVLLADEPVAALDLAHQLEVMSLLRRYCDQGGSVVVVLHDLRLAAHYCHRLQLLYQGETLADGGPSEVLTEANMQQAFGIRSRQGLASHEGLFALPWELN